MTTKEVASYSPPVGCCAPDRRPLPVGRDVWRGWLVHQVESFELTTPSTLPVGDSTDMGYSQSELLFNLCVNVLVRPTRISPRQSGAAGGRAV